MKEKNREGRRWREAWWASGDETWQLSSAISSSFRWACNMTSCTHTIHKHTHMHLIWSVCLLTLIPWSNAHAVSCSYNTHKRFETKNIYILDSPTLERMCSFIFICACLHACVSVNLLECFKCRGRGDWWRNDKSVCKPAPTSNLLLAQSSVALTQHKELITGPWESHQKKSSFRKMLLCAHTQTK